MATTFSWGILGTGNIARQFAAGLNAVPQRHRIAAVGSRSADTARAFAATHGIAQAYGSYEAVLADPAVQAVYISLPNSLHHPWTLRALAAGKHVLCEKPLANDAAEAAEMFDAAQRHGRVLEEAFMYRSHPLTHAWLGAVRGGAIGQVKVIRSSFLYATNKIAGNVRFDVALGGGALMDIGCYCLNLARLVAGGEPKVLQAAATMHECGVDHYTVGLLGFEHGILATFACGMAVRADNTAIICGDQGYVEVPIPWKPPVRDAVFAVVDAAGKRTEHKVSADTELYALEANDFAATVLDGAPAVNTALDTLGNMRALDTLRERIGLRFGRSAT